LAAAAAALLRCALLAVASCPSANEEARTHMHFQVHAWDIWWCCVMSRKPGSAETCSQQQTEPVLIILLLPYGSCSFAVRDCPDVPATQANANNFSSICAGLTHSRNCTANCLDNAFGGWTATCDANRGWVYSGACPGM
jgi:hypothetical protein